MKTKLALFIAMVLPTVSFADPTWEATKSAAAETGDAAQRAGVKFAGSVNKNAPQAGDGVRLLFQGAGTLFMSAADPAADATTGVLQIGAGATKTVLTGTPVVVSETVKVVDSTVTATRKTLAE